MYLCVTCMQYSPSLHTDAPSYIVAIQHTVFHVLKGTTSHQAMCHKIVNEEGCRDDTVPKLLRPCEVGVSMQQSPATPSLCLVFRGCRRLLHTLTPTSKGLLVSWHSVIPTSSNFTVVSLIFPSHKHGPDMVDSR